MSEPLPRSDRVPEGFVDLTALLPSARFQIAYACEDNFTGAALPGYERAGAWMREEPARALSLVERAARERGYRLLIFDAYRPVRATRAMCAWAEAQGRADWIGVYIARYSQHNLGLAVDLTLVGPAGPLDMGTPFDDFSPASHEGGVAGPAAQNRTLLRQLMVERGFRPARTEWWHFGWPDPGHPALDVPYR